MGNLWDETPVYTTLTVVANASGGGKPRRVVENGVEYLVTNAVLIVPGVLPGSNGPLYYPPKEVQSTAKDWDHIPVTNRHPYDPLTNKPLTANTPGVLERQGIGEVRAPRFNKKLKAELWVDVKKADKVDNRIVPALESGEKVELSTGLYTTNEPANPGATYNGRTYSHIARNYQPDHLAILLDERGACSVADGCGVNVTNARVQNLQPEEPVVTDHDDRTFLSWLKSVFTPWSRSPTMHAPTSNTVPVTTFNAPGSQDPDGGHDLDPTAPARGVGKPGVVKDSRVQKVKPDGSANPGNTDDDEWDSHSPEALLKWADESIVRNFTTNEDLWLSYNARWDAAARKALAKSSPEDFAGPHQSFPIKDQSDVSDAAHLIGHADDPAAVKAKIKRIAAKKGFKVPATWNHEESVTANLWTDEARAAAAATHRALAQVQKQGQGKTTAGDSHAVNPMSPHSVAASHAAGSASTSATGMMDGVTSIAQQPGTALAAKLMHDHAAHAHDIAGLHHSADGNDHIAKSHATASKHHRTVARNLHKEVMNHCSSGGKSMTGNALRSLEDAELTLNDYYSGYDVPAHGNLHHSHKSSTRALMVTYGTQHAPAMAHAHKAFKASLGRDHKTAKTFHLNAAKEHDAKATEIRKSDPTSYLASDHDKAAQHHRTAASIHHASLTTNSSADSSNTEGSMTRQQVIEKLTANCGCDTKKAKLTAAYNKMDNEELEVAANTLLAIGDPKKTVQVGGAEEDEDDLPPVKKAKIEEKAVPGVGKSGSVKSDNSATDVEAWLASAPAPVQSAVRNAMETEAREKARLIHLLTANVKNDETKKRLITNHGQKSIAQLRDEVEALGLSLNAASAAPSYAGYITPENFQHYLGGAGVMDPMGGVTTNAAGGEIQGDEQNILKLPVMNWDEMGSEEDKGRKTKKVQ